MLMIDAFIFKFILWKCTLITNLDKLKNEVKTKFTLYMEFLCSSKSWLPVCFFVVVFFSILGGFYFRQKRNDIVFGWKILNFERNFARLLVQQQMEKNFNLNIPYTLKPAA